jgi:protein TonB
MERHFVIPITIAAALHAGLLFGIRRHPAAVPPMVTKIIRWIPPEPMLLDPPPPPEPEETSPVLPKGSAGEPPPSLVESLTLPRPNDFPIEIPRHFPTTALDVTKIPQGTIGIPDGSDIGGLAGPGFLSLKDLDNVPRARLQTGPAYPPEARRLGLSGEVLVEFTVNESGLVVAPRAVRSTDRMFEESALRAVAKWRFEPGLRDGRAVSFRMAVPIVFTLSDN